MEVLALHKLFKLAAGASSAQCFCFSDSLSLLQCLERNAGAGLSSLEYGAFCALDVLAMSKVVNLGFVSLVIRALRAMSLLMRLLVVR